MENTPRLTRALAGVALATWLAAASPAAADDASLAREVAEEARMFASRDDYGRAVACAGAAIILDPSLEGELAMLIANQLTWQERAAEAIPWYERYLEDHPGDREARLGLARALSWSGDLAGAAAIYEQLLVEDPTDEEARLGLARMSAWREKHGAAVETYRDALEKDAASREARLGLAAAENARGRHREAERMYRKLLEEDPDDVEARVGLARALHWMGEHEAAERELAGVPGEEAEKLREAIASERWRRVSVFAESYVDVDEQENDWAGARFESAAGYAWRWSAEGAVGRADETRTPSLRLLRAGGGGAWRASRAWSLHAIASVLGVGRNLSDDETIDVGAGETITGEDAKGTYLVWDTWVSWTPLDWTRVDLGFARIPIEVPRALARGIRVDMLSLGLDRRFREPVMLHARVSRGAYTDGNGRTGADGDLTFGPYRISPVRLWPGLGAHWFSFDEQLDHGYYSPANYDAIYVALRGASPLGAGFTVDANVRLGSEREDTESRFGVLAGGIELRWSGVGGFGASVRWLDSMSRFDTSAGYGRRGLGLSVFRTS